MSRSTTPAPLRLLRAALVGALALGAVVALQAPSEAVTVTTIGDLQAGMSTCTNTPDAPYTVVLGGDLTDTTAELYVHCHAEIDLNGHDLTVRNVVLNFTTSLEVTDSTPAAPGADPNADAGTLTANAAAEPDKAGILVVFGTSVTTAGTATVIATGGDGGAGIGASSGAPTGQAGTVTANDTSAITATGGQSAAGIGGGPGGPDGTGGTTTANDRSTITATGGDSAAGIGGSAGGTGGTTTANGESTITATGGATGAGIGGGGFRMGGTTTANDNATITATGGASAAGIGGGFKGAGGTTTSNDTSTITATGGTAGPGIGSGSEGGWGGTTTSNDASTITATGRSGGAGIGGGDRADGGTTTSNGTSTINATGGSGAAGIGSGGDGNRTAGTTTSNDTSTINATGGFAAAGIGGGTLSAGGTTTSNDTSTITATGRSGGAGIGGGFGKSGGSTVIDGGSTMIASGGGAEISAVSVAGAGSPATGPFLTITDGTLELGSDLQVPDADGTPEVSIGANGVITRRTSPASTATITGSGTIANGGAITLPTAAIAPTLVTDRHHGVTFDTQGGSAAPAPVTVYADTFVHGERTFPPDPTKTGVEFLGWNTAADGTGTAVTATTPLPGTSTDGAAVALTLYAIFGQPGSNLTDLDYALAHCTSTPATPYQVTLTADLADVATELTVSCDAVIDLAGHDLTVRNVVVAAGKELEVTDTTPVADGPDPNADAGTLTADASAAADTAGIQTTDATLTTSGTAQVIARGGDAAGIGGGNGGNGGTTTANDTSTITATGGVDSAGIGGGYHGHGGTTTANDSATITATGGIYAAGIGGAQDYDGGTTTANDSSSIIATGGLTGAGIGGGLEGRGGTTTSNDSSTITATGKLGGAGVGGGSLGAGGTTTSNDSSTITATGGKFGAGIGGGSGLGLAGTTTINGASTMIATGGAEGGSAVGLGAFTGPQPGTFLTITSGTLLLGSDLKVPDAAGDPEVSIGAGGVIALQTPATTAAITGDGLVENSGAITLPTDAVAPTLVSNRHHRVTFDTQGGSTAPDPVTVYADTFTHGERTFPPDPTRAGYAFMGWNTAANGTGDAVGTDTVLPGSSTDGTAHPVTAYAQWADPSSDLPGLKTALATCTGTPATPYLVALTTDLANPATELVVNCDARIDLAGHDLTVRNVIVAAGTSLEVTDTTPVAPGPDPNADAGTLTADATGVDGVAGIQSAVATLATSGTAKVVATGGPSAAGIGGTSSADGGTTTSHDSSTITATGGSAAAGIGGGSAAAGGTTTSHDDSTITATGGSGSAGIGGGFLGRGGTTTSHDTSTITATGGPNGAGIGGGSFGSGGTTTIADGSTVLATAGAVGSASAIGVGNGGTAGVGTFLTVEGTLRLGGVRWSV